MYSETPAEYNTKGNIMNVPTELEVTLEGGRKVKTKTKFIYKEDPVVERIEPERSFLRYVT